MARRVATGTRAKDVKQPLFVAAEDRVWAWLLAHAENHSEPFIAGDARKKMTYYDFSIGAYKVDVKVDQYATDTGRVAWEEWMSRGGRRWPGWGQHEDLDYIVYVMPREDDETWPALLVDAAKLRRVAQQQDGRHRTFQKVGTDGLVADGVAVSIEALREAGALLREIDLVVL